MKSATILTFLRTRIYNGEFKIALGAQLWLLSTMS